MHNTIPNHQTAPGDTLLSAILRLWQEVLTPNAGALQADTHFFLAGGDSLQLARLLLQIKKQFGLTLHLQDAATFSTPARMSVVCQRLLADGRAVETGTNIATPDYDTYPASSMQQGLWYETQCAGDKGLYNTALAVHLKGRQLDVPRLQHALRLLIQQHPVLRSQFILPAGSSILQVRTAPLTAFELPVSLTAAHVLAETLAGAASIPFDLSRNPCRFHVYRIDRSHHVLFICLHHCVTDGWSGNVLLRNLASIWNALLENPDWVPLAVDRGQARYCHAEALGRENNDFLEALTWWQRQAHDILQCSDWLGGMPQAGPFRLSTETLLLRTAAIQASPDATPHTAATACTRLLSAFRLAILELTGDGNCLIGMPVSGRHNVLLSETGLEQSAGCFVNLLLSHDGAGSAETPRRRLQRLHAHHLQALSRASVPFADVARALHLGRRASGNIAFDILFAFQNSPRQAVMFTGLAHALQQITPEYGPYPLALSIRPGSTGFQCRLEYAADVFSTEWARTLLATCQKKLG